MTSTHWRAVQQAHQAEEIYICSLAVQQALVIAQKERFQQYMYAQPPLQGFAKLKYAKDGKGVHN
jgi:hypothetical protein